MVFLSINHLYGRVLIFLSTASLFRDGPRTYGKIPPDGPNLDTFDDFFFGGGLTSHENIKMIVVFAALDTKEK